MNRAWNPLHCTGFRLPPNMLLMAKLVVLYLIAGQEYRKLSDGFLPFWNWGGAWGPSPEFEILLQILFWVFSLGLLLNRFPRLCSAGLGLLLFTSVLTSRVLYSNNRLFFACLLFLTGLQGDKKRDVFLIRWQVVLVYLGAGVNKILDPDWQSGQFMEHWLTGVLDLDLHQAMAGWLGSPFYFQILSWATILTEWLLAILFLIPAAYGTGVILGLLFHAVMIPVSGWSVSYMFFYSMACSYLAFFDWPQEPVEELRTKKGISRVRLLFLDPRFYFALAALFILFQEIMR